MKQLSLFIVFLFINACWADNQVHENMVFIPSGTFRMGSKFSPNEIQEKYGYEFTKSVKDGWGIELPTHQVSIDGKWTQVKNMGESYNSEGIDGSPCVSKDGKYLFFTSTRESIDPRKFDGALDIYVAKFNVMDWKNNL